MFHVRALFPAFVFAFFIAFSIAVGAMPARAAPGDGFLAHFDAKSDKPRAFPSPFPVFDMHDKPASIPFGGGQPWRLINFWAAWCGPCIEEMPSLKALQDRTAGSKSFRVVLVSADMLPSAAALRYMMDQKNLPKIDSALYIKDYPAWESLGVDGLPTTYLVSPEGRIVYSMTGSGDWNSPEAKAFLRDKLPKDAVP